MTRIHINLKGATFGPTGGKMKGRGTTYSPYVGIPLNKNWSADLSAGWGKTEVDTSLSAGGGTQGKMDDDRTTFAAGLTYRQLFGADSKWMLTGRGAYIYVKDKLGAYTLTNGHGCSERRG
ncbi:MAG: autotransporter outer membrane beta-barrel domain-containing protein [Sulfuritalea sp.]|nr:autotransporter outer membrane beta-barrel domain-containing protein [Sulfuritalea sp.]